jgi:hypothetical protein
MIENRSVPLFILLFIIFLTSGCATIVRGTNQSLSITSEPQGAVAKLSNGQSCVTPCQIKLKRNQGITIVFEKEGCDTTYLIVSPRLAPSGALIMDGALYFATGACFDLEPNPAHAILECLEHKDNIK